jgi:ribosomal protein L19E
LRRLIITRGIRRFRKQRIWKTYIKAMRRTLKKSKAAPSKVIKEIYRKSEVKAPPPPENEI